MYYVDIPQAALVLALERVHQLKSKDDYDDGRDDRLIEACAAGEAKHRGGEKTDRRGKARDLLMCYGDKVEFAKIV